MEDLTFLSYLKKHKHSTHVYMSNTAYLAVSYCLFSPEKVQVSCGRGVDSISHIMSGSERRLGHCVSDIGCIGFSWNDSRRGGGGGGWRKNNLIIPPHTWPQDLRDRGNENTY